MSREEMVMLGSAACDGFGETYIKRHYGEPWGAGFTIACGLVARGWLKYKSCHREPSSGDFIRRYVITDIGRAASRRAHGVAP